MLDSGAISNPESSGVMNSGRSRSLLQVGFQKTPNLIMSANRVKV
jgi:hypothetical protein